MKDMEVQNKLSRKCSTKDAAPPQVWSSDQQVKCYDPKICDSCDTVITDFYIMKVSNIICSNLLFKI